MKKRIILGTFIIMLVSFLFHDVYKLWPCFLTSILFPVNESIFEHAKLIVLSFIVWILVEKFFLKDETNIISSNLFASIICIIIDFLIFTPVYLYILKTNDNMFITILIYLISIIASLIIREYYLRREKDHLIEIGSIIGFIVVIITLGVLTYHPINVAIFYDFNNKLYGIPN